MIFSPSPQFSVNKSIEFIDCNALFQCVDNGDGSMVIPTSKMGLVLAMRRFSIEFRAGVILAAS